MNPYQQFDGQTVRVTWGYFPGSPKNVVTEGVLHCYDYQNMVHVKNETIGIALIASVEPIAATALAESLEEE